MEDSLLFSHLSNGIWFEIQCCYCGTKEPIHVTYNRCRHGTDFDYKPKSRLQFVIDFIKYHYKNIYYRLDQEKVAHTIWMYDKEPLKTPDCALLRETNHIDKPFKLIDKDNNEYTFNPQDKEFKNLLKQIKSWLNEQ